MTDYREEDGPALTDIAVVLAAICAVAMLWYTAC